MRIIRSSTIWTAAGLALILGGGLAAIGAQVHPWGALVGGVAAGVVLYVSLRTPYRRWRWAQQGVPESWRRWMQRHVPPYAALDADGRARFEQDVRFLMEEFDFEGVRGVSATEELCLSVAAGAALLLHGHPDWELPGTRSILFYPAHFDDEYSGGRDAGYDGMAHGQGPLIMSAPSVRASWMHPGDGNNVVLHELAHLFDFDNTGPDGVPSFVDSRSAEAWQSLIRTEMRKVEQGTSMLDPYAATAPSEFFAVAVEHFFEEPHAMKQQHPELFEAMATLFNWTPTHPSERSEQLADKRSEQSDEAPDEEGTC